FFDENQTGQLMSRVTNDVGMVQFFITGALVQAIAFVLMVGLNVWAMATINLTLTVLTLSIAPLIVLIQLEASKIMPMWRKIQQLGFINMMSQQAIAGGERIFEIIDTPLDVAEKPGALDLRPMRGQVAFEGVSFAYGDGPSLLRDISFAVGAGRTLAIVGPSG